MTNLNLNYEGFETYLLNKWRDDITRRDGSIIEGIHYVFKFDNNYGASVIKHFGSCGYEDDRWELAVVSFIYYDKPNTFVLEQVDSINKYDSVVGYLTDEEVKDLLEKIKAL